MSKRILSILLLIPTLIGIRAIAQAADETARYADFFRAGWEDARNPYKLPDWFEGNRVQAHTRLSLNWYGRPEFENAAQGFKDMGVKVFTRHSKTGDEDPWWQSATLAGIESKDGASKFGGFARPKDRNIIKEYIADAHRKGLRVITYNWMMTDRTMEALHPDWVCKNLAGQPIEHRGRGTELDVTGPYREVILNRLLELAEMGTDGFYFDEAHLPLDGVWGTALARDFKQSTGMDAPKSKDENDPVYRSFISFRSYSLMRAFKYWRDAVKRKYPNVVFIVATEAVPGLTELRGDTNLVRLADSPKSEWLQAVRGFNLVQGSVAKPDDDIRMAFGWTLLRDAGDGRPPHIWATGFPTKEQVMAFTAALVTYGSIANVNVQEQSILKPANVPIRSPGDSYKPAFDLGNKVSPYLHGTLPLRWAAVHFSELARNARGADHVKAWREVLWPVTGAFGVLTRDHLPVCAVDDYQLEKGQLDGYRILFLTSADELTPGQRKAVQGFKASGGIVIANDPNWHWDDPAKTKDAGDAFRKALRPYAAKAPVQVTGPKRMHSVAYRNKAGRLVIALSNSFTWVQMYTPKQPQDFPKHNQPPAPIADAVITVKAEKLPKKVLDAVSGKSLKAEPAPGGYRVRVPGFEAMALIVAE